jgi:outer membrane protein assembly factor BamD
MKIRRPIIYFLPAALLFLSLFLSVFCPQGWSGETVQRGKLTFFTPPDIKGLSAEQVMQKSVELEEKGDYNQGIEILNEYIKQNSDVKFAPELHYRLGVLYIRKDKYIKAYDILNNIFEKYPNMNNPDRVLEKMFEVANALYNGKRRKLIGIPLGKQYRKAIEIFEKIISHAPFGQYSEVSQLDIGKTYMLLDEREKAIDAFEKLIKEYPDSSHCEEALFLVGVNHDKLSKRSDYDQKETDRAVEMYQKFLSTYPASSYAKETNESLAFLLDRKGRENFTIAKYYYDRKKYGAAKIYFNIILEKYSMTPWADRSTKYLSQIDLQKEGENKEGGNENKNNPS